MNIKVGDLVRVKSDWTETGESWGIIAKIDKGYYYDNVVYWAHWSDTKEGVKIATKEEADNTFESSTLTYIRLDSGKYEFDIICGYNSPLWKVLNGEEV